MLDKVILIITMGKTIRKTSAAKDSASTPLGKPSPGDKTLGLDTEICFYYIEDVDETKE